MPVGAEGLRALAGCGGCAAKVAPELTALLGVAASSGHDDTLLAGLSPPDDAAVYPLDAERALVSSLDFFPPLVDDPGDYGAVAAANAVSDVYAMGGTVAFGLVISGFPSHVPAATVLAATDGATRVVGACGGLVVGGHSIHCREPVFGLAITGFVHPQRVWRKSGARPGVAAQCGHRRHGLRAARTRLGNGGAVRRGTAHKCVEVAAAAGGRGGRQGGSENQRRCEDSIGAAGAGVVGA